MDEAEYDMKNYAYREEQSFNLAGGLFHTLAALNINERCPYHCFTQGKIKFLVQIRVFLEWIVLNLRNFSDM